MPTNWIHSDSRDIPSQGNNRADRNLQAELEQMFMEHMEQNMRTDSNYIEREISRSISLRAEQNILKERSDRERVVQEYERQKREKVEQEIKALRDEAEKIHNNPLNSLEL